MAQEANELHKGMALHKAGDLHQAEQAYRQVLHVDPRHADALHLLGLLGQQRGEPAVAVEYISRAIAVNNTRASYHTNLAAAQNSLQRFTEAERSSRRAIRIDPKHAQAHYNLALSLESQGLAGAAIESYGRVIELKPTIAEAHLNRGNVFRNLGRTEEAERCFRRAIEVRPGYATAHYNLGHLLHAKGEKHESAECFRRALKADPAYPDARFNLAVALEACGKQDEAVVCLRETLARNPEQIEAARKLGQMLAAREELAEAVGAFRQLIAHFPTDAAAHNSLGQMLLKLGQLDDAESSFRRAIELHSGYALAWNNLGVVFHSRNDTPSAIAHFRQALKYDLQQVQANSNLGTILRNTGAMEEAIQCFDRVLERQPHNARVRILKGLMLPPIYDSHAHVECCRAAYTANLAALLADGVRLDPEAELMVNPFYLPYQGLDDCALQRDLATFYPVAASPPACQIVEGDSIVECCSTASRETPRIRVGFVSHHFRAHTIGHLLRGVIAELSREKFSVTVFSIGEFHDDVADSIRDQADEFVILPVHAMRARQMIADCNLNVLFYSDIGMDPYAYSLAFHRLAPVQCVMWGHPVTTGIPNVDYFVSSELFETEGSDDQYTEQLVRLRGLNVYYYRPQPPAQPHDRAHYGIAADCHLYYCPQSLFKFHPDFDAVLGEILARDPEGLVYLIEGLEPEWRGILQSRFRRTIPATADRIVFLPRQSRDDFLNLMTLCDVMLDTLHFGGGNTSYEAFSQGVPIVSLPSQILRGRLTAGLYQRMGLSDCIVHSVEEYLDLAVRLGTDRTYRRTMQSRILAANRVLFEDRESLQAIEEFLETAVEAVRRGQARVGAG